MALIDRVKEISKKQGLSLTEVAIKAGIGEKSIYAWKNREPSIAIVQKVADVLHVSIDYLIGETQNPSGDGNNAELPDLREVDRDVLSYGGRPISERDWQIIKNILETGLYE